MKPGMRMLAMERVRRGDDRPRRSDYGGGNDRRLIGYDRNEEAPGMRHDPYPMRHVPPMTAGVERTGMPYMPPGSRWELPYTGGYGDEPEARRRRDKRGRYMIGDADRDDDDDESRHAGKGRMIAHGAVWYDEGRQGGGMLRGVDEDAAMEWVQKMTYTDESGTTRRGPFFKTDQMEQLRTAHCPGCDKWEFAVAINMMYADYCKVAKKMGVDRPDFYACMAKAFLMDEDAPDGKLEKYMRYVAEK